jgi:hypothetical protein
MLLLLRKNRSEKINYVIWLFSIECQVQFMLQQIREGYYSTERDMCVTLFLQSAQQEFCTANAFNSSLCLQALLTEKKRSIQRSEH